MLQPATLQFLKALKKNNHKEWFDLNRKRYEAAKEDFEQFISTLIEKHVHNDAGIAGLQAKNCIFRINRDVRFSKNKAPYKTNFGASIAMGGKKSPFAGYYFHCEPGGASFVGGGLWQPEPDTIKNIRQEIDYNLEEFESILRNKAFKSVYGQLYSGEDQSLKKIPRGYDKDNPAGPYLMLKSWIAMRPVPDEMLQSPQLLKYTLKSFETLQPLLQFLNRAIAE
jgi:uncharacterized protein (TIGR02453 family)